MTVPRIFVLSTVCIFILSGFVFADSSGRIYGRITTVDDDIFEGLIRWDKNEGNWIDMLDGNKEKSKKYSKRYKRKKYRRRETSIEIFGIKIGGRSSSSSDWSSVSQSGIRFGHIKTLNVVDDDRALLILKSGEEVELFDGSTDIGEGIREIVIEDRDEGELELLWEDIDRIDFMPAKKNLVSNYGNRLYGTLTTRRGDEYTGFVTWDIDEIFENDILDGDEKRRSRKIKFGKIAAIERYSSSGATVILKNGNEILLKGSNDVDDGNRGIIIADPGFGQVTVQWDEFDRLEFSEAPEQVTYDEFDGGKPLEGVVYTEDGDKYQGKIRWDDDEEYTWEILDGSYHDVEFDIEFGKIARIKKKSHRSSLVTLADGRQFRLRGSNDVDDDNGGIFITLDDGEEVEVDWDEFDYVNFDK